MEFETIDADQVNALMAREPLDLKVAKKTSNKDDQDKPKATKRKSTTAKKTTKPKSGPLKPKQSET